MKRLTSLLVDGMDMEHHKQGLAPKKVLVQRLGKCLGIASLFLIVTISFGTLAYHFLDHEAWVDANLNAVMIMTGLGLVGSLSTTAAKIFTSFYSLISSVVFFLVLGILFAPLIHRFLHKFHLELDKDK